MKTAIIGGGKGCRDILELAVEGRLQTMSLEVMVVVDPDPEAPGMVYAREDKIPTMSDLDTAVRLPGLELILEVTGKDIVLERIYQLVPPGVRVMDHVLARVFWDVEQADNRLREELEKSLALERETEQSEHRFRQFLDAAHDMIVMKDLSGRYLFINQQAAAMTGKSPEDFLGRTDPEVLPAGLAEQIMARDREVMEEKSHVSRGERLVIGGKEHFLDTVRFPLLDYKEDVIGVASISRDVTEQKQLHRELIQSERLAAVGKLAAGIAHEINNPLTGILTFIESLLLDAASDDPNREDYEVIMRETMRCRRIVRDLLDYSRLEKPRRVHSQLNRLVERAVSLVGKQAEFHDIKFEWDLEEDLPEVLVDPNQIQQVILNLVINAKDAMDKAGTIYLRTRLEDSKENVLLDVEDQGRGIAPEKYKTIFEPFFTTKGAQGNGLGLPVVMRIVEQHQGKVSVGSEEGKGSTFRITLPAAGPEDAGD